MRFGRATRIGRAHRFGLDQRSNYLPSDEGGLLLWIDMQDPTKFVQSGGVVTQVTNKASGVIWPAAGSTRPAYEATGFNGFPCMHSDGVDDTFISTEVAIATALDASTVAKPYTLIFLVQPDVADINTPVFSAANSGIQSLDTRKWGQDTQASGRWDHSTRVHGTGITNALIYDKRPVTLTPTMVSYWGQTNHSIQVNLDNPRSGPADPVVCFIDRMALFCRPDLTPDSYWAGRFAELVLFDSILSTDAIGRLQDYIGGRWLL